MSRFNVKGTKPLVKGPLATDLTPTGRTGQGAPGWQRDEKTELFLLAVSNMVGKATFYETAAGRDSRYQQLIRDVTAGDPEWVLGFLTWLRSEGNMRTASLIGALEAAHIMIELKIPGGRKIVSSVLQRADEPGEAVAYWMSRFGRKMPASVKRGIADGALRLYSEYTALKYDTASHAIRFGDVLELTHPADRPNASQHFRGNWQKDLFKFLIGNRHNRVQDTPETLTMWRAREELLRRAQDVPGVLIQPDNLKAAGFTWENALSLAGNRVEKKALWEAMIPSMNYMGLLRNLRNFDQAGVSDEIAAQVAARLTDPDAVAGSKQFPFRFLSAYQAVQSLRWGQALETAMNLSLSNIPVMEGRTLILVDRSHSMFHVPIEERARLGAEALTLADQAAIFGTAVAVRNAGRSTLVEFGNTSAEINAPFGSSVLRLLNRFHDLGGTYTVAATRAHFRGHDRVIVITDEQSHDGAAGSVIPADIPVYTWNVGGHVYSAGPTGKNRYLFGGLTDHAFKLIPMLEAGRDGNWPWIKDNQ